MAVIPEYGWQIPTWKQNQYYSTIVPLFQNLGTELYSRSKDLQCNGYKISGDIDPAGRLILQSTTHITPGYVQILDRLLVGNPGTPKVLESEVQGKGLVQYGADCDYLRPTVTASSVSCMVPTGTTEWHGLEVHGQTESGCHGVYYNLSSVLVSKAIQGGGGQAQNIGVSSWAACYGDGNTWTFAGQMEDYVGSSDMNACELMLVRSVASSKLSLGVTMIAAGSVPITPAVFTGAFLVQQEQAVPSTSVWHTGYWAYTGALSTYLLAMGDRNTPTESGVTTTFSISKTGSIYSTGGIGLGGIAAPSSGLAIQRYSGGNTNLTIFCYAASNARALINFYKSYQNSVGNTVTPDGDELADLNFYGNTGSGWGSGAAARLMIRQMGTAGASYVPGAFTFLTSDGVSAAAERMRITSAGKVGIGTAAPGYDLEIVKAATAGTGVGIRIQNTEAGVGNFAGYYMVNDLRSSSLVITSTTYTPSGWAYADCCCLVTDCYGGISIGTSYASAEIRMYTGGSADPGNLRLKIQYGGGVNIYGELQVGGIVTESWIAPTLLNSWANSGHPASDAGYMKDPMGFVHLRGMVQDGTYDGIPIFVLPSGYRPDPDQYIAIVAGSPSYTGELYINHTNGEVSYQGVALSTRFVCLDGVSFKAA